MKSLLFQNVQADLSRKLCYTVPSHQGVYIASKLTKPEKAIQAEIIVIMLQVKLVKMLDFVRSERHSICTQKSSP